MFNNKFIYFLGKISLPIYLSHLPAINLTKGLFMNESIVIKVILVLVFTSIFTTITYIIGNLIGKRINKTTQTYIFEKIDKRDIIKKVKINETIS